MRKSNVSNCLRVGNQLLIDHPRVLLTLCSVLLLGLFGRVDAEEAQIFDQISPLATSLEDVLQEGQPILVPTSGFQDIPEPTIVSRGSANNWLNHVRVGYDGGFVIASDQPVELGTGRFPFRLALNGWGQLRHTVSDLDSGNDQNQFQLKRARLLFSGSTFTPDFRYFVQLDGRSSSGDDLRLLDYYLQLDIGRRAFGFEPGRFGFRTGKWKMPFSLARYLSGRQFEFSDRSVASTFFDVNRSLGWGINGRNVYGSVPVSWEVAIFNGLVTGGAETGSSGTLDDNFAYSGRIIAYPTGKWGEGQLADFDYHQCPATRIGAAFANSTINEGGSTEFGRIRVVDSGARLSDVFLVNMIPVSEYTVNLFAVDYSMKYQGWSLTSEYYFRTIDQFEGADVPRLFDHGLWLQLGKFVVPRKLQFISRWSRVVGNSGTLGENDESADEIAGGLVWYLRDQHAKFTFDITYLTSGPISSAALDVAPGDVGWFYRSQVQFSF